MYLCKTSDIPSGTGKSFSLATANQIKKTVFVINKQGLFYAYINSCPHLDIPLDWDNDQFFDAEGELIQCATHGALFIPATGECIYGPCNGEALAKVSIAINDGKIVVCDK